MSNATISDDLILFEDTLNAISRAKTLASLRGELLKICNIYSVANIVYHVVSIPWNVSHNNLLLLTYDDSWVERYHSRDYFRLDPVVQSGRNGFLPIDWQEVDRDTPDGRRFFAEADAYGVGRNGVSLPIRGRHGERALFTVTSNASQREWTSLRLRYMRDFQVVGHFIHDRALEIAGLNSPPPGRRPSSPEMQCLQAFARGRPPKRIAADLAISESAVRLYLHSIRRKLGSATTTQAVAVALKLALIEA